MREVIGRRGHKLWIDLQVLAPTKCGVNTELNDRRREALHPVQLTVVIEFEVYD